MNLYISKKKFKCIILALCIIFIQTCVGLKVMAVKSDIDYALISFSWISLFGFVIEIALWKYMTDELFCPYIVFISVLYIFSCGQSIGWTLGIDLGGQDLWYRHDFGMNHLWLIKSLVYSTLAFSFFHFGAMVFYSGKRKKTLKYSSNNVYNAYKIIAKPLLVLCIPAFIVNCFRTIIAVAIGGYGAYYDTLESQSNILTLMSYIADYYQPCLLLLLLAYRDKKQYRRVIIILMLLETICQLYIGGRSGAVMTVLGIMLSIHYFVKPFNIKNILKYGCFGYVGLAFLNAIQETRNMIGHNLQDVIVAVGSSFTDAVGHFIGELGWSMSSTVWTMMLVPSQYDFRYGTSYLTSLLVPIPNLGFWEVHPAKLYANVGDWLEKVLNYDHGIGYSMTAESYINFGWYGLIVMFIWGTILVKVLANTKRVNVEENIVGATFQILVIMTIMKSLVRSSFSNSLRAIVYVLIPLYIIITQVLKRRNCE
nr:O-antigen polysaccharide polymerase Wzy [uncultured Agathobacter sp.]